MNVNQVKSAVKWQVYKSGIRSGLLAGAILAALGGCAEEPSPWTKSSSPWERNERQAKAPAAESYKADLEMSEEPATASEVELSYQAEPVESFVPEAEDEVVSAQAEPEPVAYDPEPEVSSGEAVASGTGLSILDQPANYYTVQLMASVDIDRVHRFAEENQISTEFIVATQRDGVTWHVLLLGIYEDYSAASASKSEVAPLLKTEPWIRRVGSVQKLMQ
ncbi:hypothetical protein MNBD_GAMMA11-153 [hydrothermal vent metagenome]|uniref:SPOR domain-containing protein n=1 Tax=hydrothermal vent metagenome TaxID=652676 RepID=A0A3B0WQY6_9ZZZZ